MAKRPYTNSEVPSSIPDAVYLPLLRSAVFLPSWSKAIFFFVLFLFYMIYLNMWLLSYKMNYTKIFDHETSRWEKSYVRILHSESSIADPLLLPTAFDSPITFFSLALNACSTFVYFRVRHCEHVLAWVDACWYHEMPSSPVSPDVCLLSYALKPSLPLRPSQWLHNSRRTGSFPDHLSNPLSLSIKMYCCEFTCILDSCFI
jgi:hypothetical protein